MSDEPIRDLQEASTRSKTPDAVRSIRDWVVVILVALIAALLVRTYVLQQFYIAGPSMETTLFQDNRVLVNKLSYRLHDVHRGDVVVFDRVTADGAKINHDDLIKRVIALPGDSIEIRSCDVYVNGTKLVENYLDKSTLSEADPAARCRVPDMQIQDVPIEQVFVMGDNRAESFDSRSFGPIEIDRIVGRAFVIVWPISNWGLL